MTGPDEPRPVRDGDSDALIELITACWDEYDGLVMAVDEELPHLRAPASAYDRWDGRAWVVDEVGAASLAGSVGVVPVDGWAGAELRMLYVRARHRRRGLASRLVALAETEAAARGARWVELWTDTRFVDAHRFYERLGYERLPGTRELHDLSETVEFHYKRAIDA